MRANRRSVVRRTALAATGLTTTLALAACSQSAGGSQDTSAEEYPSKTIQFMVPAAAGGGWDSTARAMQKVIESEDVVSEPVEVFNVEGGGGATGLSQLQKSEGDPHALMMTGLVMIGALEQADSPVSLEDTTPIATLTSEAEAFVVPADSEFTSIEDVVKAYQEDPSSVTFGGGSAGGSDQLVVAELLKEAGAEPGEMKYVGYSGGGEATAGVLSGDIAVGVSGVSEFEGQIESGDMRLLAVSTADPIEVAGEEAPTLADAGYDVDFANWRALVAAPGLSDEQVDSVTAVIDEMHGTDAWKEQLEANGWGDFYKTGDEAQQYFADEIERVGALYEDLGL
ncbi:Bug family tripartite tricarboxylate transporter substrate binding protein [Nocardioides mesophilus]|uniref:Tripartite tricarboxylate transporter substrate binding protein n=1 Tax=Nocardioides mesophilus TaxID=433659 RepID=A0A7G9RE21_9ACTN|nr:tripartite tricarboxylate transporter substrate binding protein [Nocardioides mesophilus]QNN53846.1 tripartite tricarboxylate transporter substrate binding protein [Nocardioides mesophilus]